MKLNQTLYFNVSKNVIIESFSPFQDLSIEESTLVGKDLAQLISIRKNGEGSNKRSFRYIIII